MHLFYVVDALDVKKMIFFLSILFVDFYDFFSILSPHWFNLDHDVCNIEIRENSLSYISSKYVEERGSPLLN